MSKEIQLSALPEWDKNLIELLKEKWITTADQIIAICSSQEGLEQFAEYSGLSIVELQNLIDRTKSHFSSERLQELTRKIDTSKYGLGAREP